LQSPLIQNSEPFTLPGAKLHINGTGELLNVSNATHSFLYVNETTGRIGIGTTTPTAKLHLDSGEGGNGLIIQDAAPVMIFYDDNRDANQRMTRIVQNSQVFYLGKVDDDLSSNVVHTLVVDTDSQEVGIGTTNPLNALSVVGDINATGKVNASELCIAGDCKTAWSEVSSSSAWVAGSGTIYNTTANVGIGTDNPGALLHINGTGELLNVSNSTHSFLYVNETTGRIGIGTTNPKSNLHVNGSNIAGFIHATGGGSSHTQAATIMTSTDDYRGAGHYMELTESGLEKTWYLGTPYAEIEGLQIGYYAADTSGGGYAAATTTSAFVTIKTSGNMGIGTTDPVQKLDVNGSINVSENVYYGGNLTGFGADFAERFTMAEPVENGDVVCLNQDMHIEKCSTKGQKSVVGIVSETPTIIGNALAPNSVPVGIVGIVTTKVTGSIDQFDLLTTSSLEGYAEKASISDFGAIIGKAMEPCYADECEIKVLVGLR